MSLSEESDCDLYEYDFYRGQHYEQCIKKKSRLIATVVQNDVEELKSLLTSPKWYNVRDKSGYDLLQIAILRNNKEVFDFLLSVESYPFDETNCQGDTALKISLEVEDLRNDHYALQLIKKGANVHVICPSTGDTLLHLAASNRYVRVAEVLILEGVDINARSFKGLTPLLSFLTFMNDDSAVLLEGVSMFLYYNADTSIRYRELYFWQENAFELSLRCDYNEYTQRIHENLFLYTIDDYSHYKLPLLILFVIIDKKSPLYREIIDRVAAIDIHLNFQPLHLSHYTASLFSVDVESLHILMEKCSDVVSDLLLVNCPDQLEYYSFQSSSIENFKLLFESELASDAIEFLGYIHITTLVEQLDEYGVPATVIIELIYYLLTYGLEVYEEDLETIYKMFGYCELFKVLLHMDIKKTDDIQRDIIPGIFYNVTFDVNTFLEDPHNYSLKALEQLLDYFALPKLKAFCYNLNVKKLTVKAERLPKVPLLLELARNAFRKFLCAKFHITSSKRFYSALQWLPICATYKNIISYETKLY